jgi:hypothetical protein
MVFFGISYFSLQSNYFITVGYKFFKAWLEGLSHNYKVFFFFNNAWILEAWWCFKKIKHKKLLTRALHSSFTPPSLGSSCGYIWWSKIRYCHVIWFVSTSSFSMYDMCTRRFSDASPTSFSLFFPFFLYFILENQA